MAVDTDLLRTLPSIDECLLAAAASPKLKHLAPAFVTQLARSRVDGWRRAILDGTLDDEGLRAVRHDLAVLLERDAEATLAPSLLGLVNATGVIVHTNLGRAPWPEAAIARAAEAARRHTNLEYDLDTGGRGRRESHVALAARLLGAEAALVVNNNAAAVLLAIDSMACGRETIVSRGELVEIGGSFRIPEILAKAGSRLVEVGTTNRTRLNDYEMAIAATTAAILKVHPSNYRVVGFTESVPIGELAALGRRRGIPVIEDLGSGAMVDLTFLGLTGEPLAAASIRAGVDLVMISGDKLLGGPQAGIIAGRREFIARLKQNPLYRALRPDKVTLAALEEVFRIYLARNPFHEVPVLRSLRADVATLRTRAEPLAKQLRDLGFVTEVVTGEATVGGGSAPESRLPSPQIAVTSPELSAATVAQRLRSHRPAVIARILEDRVILDLRTVADDEEAIILAAFQWAIRDRQK